MAEEYEILCIFGHYGRTYTFRNVIILSDNENMLEFEYKAMSDGKSKRGKFPKANIAGYSLTAK